MSTKHATRLTLLLSGFFALILFAGCDKLSPSPEEQAVQFLTGMGNRYWHIKDIYVNGVKTTLTTSQAQYTKTYTRKPFSDAETGTFTDSDGMAGTWKLNNPTQLTEIITNGRLGNDTIVNTITKLGAYEIDMFYTGKATGDKVRTVYFGY